MAEQLTMQEANELLFKLNELQQDFFYKHKKSTTQLESVPIDDILHEFCKSVVEVLKCQSINIWTFNENKTRLDSVSFYSIKYKRPKKSQLEIETMPNYFKLITDQRTIAIADIQSATLSQGLQEYFSSMELDAKSMLDASINSYLGTIGVVCCLTNEKTNWTSIHHHILSSVADMLAFIFEEVRQVKSANQIYELAYRDVTTGLYNQNGFIEIVQKRLSSGNIKYGSFICFKIDQYESIEGVVGYHGAEKLLEKVAENIKLFNLKDTIIARMAFDYFIVFSPHNAEKVFELTTTHDIVKKLARPIEIENQKFYVSFSFGISKYPEHAFNVLTGIQTAHLALKDALKMKKRQAYNVYNRQIMQNQKDLLLYESSLRKGLENDEFILYYQPKVKLESGEIIGFEALIRWQHPERGLLMPNQFIYIAETTGLIIQIGEYVIEAACKQLEKWKKKGIDTLTVSVNLSPNHFLHAHLPKYLNDMIDKYQIKAGNLILEITENIALEGLDNVVNRINELKKAGYTISIDDFGTGYSSFKYLQSYPVQQIKIDRQFIKEISHDQTSEEIVRAMIQLNKALNIIVVAEGVETEAQWQILKKYKCDQIQGFYLSEPLNAVDAEAYIKLN